MQNNLLSIQKIRHPVRMRMLQVARTHWITPYLRSIILAGEELEDFISLSFNDHVKLFVPEPGQKKPNLPQLNPNGSLDTSHMGGTVTRDFTPHFYDAQKKELELQFFIHDHNHQSTLNGPARNWALQAKPGDFIGIGGPKGSLMIPIELEWFLMIGDETAISAISRRLFELPADAVVTVMIETASPQDQIEFKSNAKKLEVRWVDKNQHTLIEEVKKWPIPSKDGFIWAAGEFSSMKEIYNYISNLNVLDKSQFKISSYWKKGHIDTHGTFGKD